ncbi:MAG: aminotransferase class V-fold PLP-dependent enzyme [Ruminococcaceae bacterium]|nr:aminotransferase class V-fold PLP-dependent enzyme [Oscillospiraceae bacterium]
MKKIYFDNAATSFPKAPYLSKTVSNFIDNGCVNINRGMYSLSSDLSDLVIETRILLARFFDCSDEPEKFCKRIIFTSGVTQSINMFLRGVLCEGDHIVTGSLEHHAVMRTLYNLKDERNITFDEALCDEKGAVHADSVESLIKPNTKAVIINHASNVFGTISDITAIGEVCKRKGVFFAVDTAQTAGTVDISMRKSNIDFLAFSGHKGLLSLQGIGGFAISEPLSKIMKPIVTGGTGSISHSYNQPDILPDKYESGTLNLCGIVALNHSLKFINNVCIDKIRDKEHKLRDYFVSLVKDLHDVKVYCADNDITTSVVSLSFEKTDNAYVSKVLESDYGVMTRCGLHCSPSAHKAMGTFPLGTVRFSFSFFNEKSEIDYCVNAIKTILKGV